MLKIKGFPCLDGMIIDDYWVSSYDGSCIVSANILIQCLGTVGYDMLLNSGYCYCEYSEYVSGRVAIIDGAICIVKKGT